MVNGRKQNCYPAFSILNSTKEQPASPPTDAISTLQDAMLPKEQAVATFTEVRKREILGAKPKISEQM